MATDQEPAQNAEPVAEPVETPPPAEDQSQNNNQQPNEPVAGGQDETLMQRYRTLQGMFNAEVPRLQQTNKALQARVDQLEHLLSTMSAQQPQPKAQPAQQTVSSLITEKDVEEYGDSIDVMRRAAREEIAALHDEIAQLKGFVGQMQANVVPRVEQVARNQAASAEQQFWSELQNRVPNWQTINSNPEFQNWLLQTDPLTGITRQTYLDDAQQALDARRVAAFFLPWMEQAGSQDVRVQSQPQPQAPNRKAELEAQVAPGRPRTVAPSLANQAKTYTQTDIKTFYNDIRAGKFKGRDAERAKIESDIFAAQRDGRIIQT
jgi:hypothetical protein